MKKNQSSKVVPEETFGKFEDLTKEKTRGGPNKMETIHSEKLRYKNADRIYE